MFYISMETPLIAHMPFLAILLETKWNHTCYMSVFKPCETDMNQDSVTDMCATRVSVTELTVG